MWASENRKKSLKPEGSVAWPALSNLASLQYKYGGVWKFGIVVNMSKEIKQVVEKVVFFSSQYGSDKSKSYTAANLAGKFYNYPNYGDFTQAFVLVRYVQLHTSTAD